MSDFLKNTNAAFQDALGSLNAAQRRAVDQIEGPVMVIAGPGTGKTHILAARIGKILLDTDALPHNILCLTFTDAGVKAMRQRLIQFIGPEAHRVHVYTYHSFCNKVIQENLEFFGKMDLEPISDLERVEILQKLLRRQEPGHPLRRGRSNDPFYYLPHLDRLFSKMKQENWTPGFLLEQIDAYLAELPARPEFIYKRKGPNFKKGDPKTALIQREVQRMEVLGAGASLFPDFVRMMEQHQRYDFDDMILWAIEAFQQNPLLLRAYQEQYLYFLVDEFQDTNGAQNKVLHQLIEFWENPNIFLVGDDDQSIYEFQGARLKNLIDFYFQYREDVALVVLRENYRSSQPILDASRALIEQNHLRVVQQLAPLGVQKILEARNRRFAKSLEKPRILEYSNQFQEEAGILEAVLELQGNNFPLEEVAIIYAEHKQAEGLADLFRKKGIPITTRRKINILNHPVIRHLLLILSYIQSEIRLPFSGEGLLYKIFYLRYWRIDLEDLAKITFTLAEQPQVRWRSAIQDPVFLQQLELKRTGSFVAVGTFLNEMLDKVSDHDMPHLLEWLINRSGILSASLEHPERSTWLGALYSFMEFVKGEAVRNPKMDLDVLLDIVQRMEYHRLSLPLQDLAKEERGVQFLTAHSAKGMEFQRVFILDATSGSWEPKSSLARYTFSFPDKVTYSGEEDALEARRRLFYVAMTRAKEQLTISYARETNAGKEQQRALFVDELVQHGGVPVLEVALSPARTIEFQALYLADYQIPAVPRPDSLQVASLLQDFSLSISALNRFLKCPLSFYFEYILRVPSVQSDTAAYGTAMHQTLQRVFEQMLQSRQKVFPGGQEASNIFENQLVKQKGFLADSRFGELLEQGKWSIRQYVDQKMPTWHKKVKLEYRIMDLEIEGVPVIGVLDKVEYQARQEVYLVDYKTSKPKKPDWAPRSSKNKNGGRYWRQLLFYKVLFENYRNSTLRVTKGIIEYLEPDQEGVFLSVEIVYDSEDVQWMKSLIQSTYLAIQNQEFYEGCGESKCTWCRFLKEQVTDTFTDQDLEALDDLE